jgi:hypothetical protein
MIDILAYLPKVIIKRVSSSYLVRNEEEEMRLTLARQ